MFFGATSFAAAPFSDVGFNPNAFVNVLGSQINQSNNTVVVLGKAVVLPTGKSIKFFSIGNLKVADVIGVDGIATALSTGTVTVAAGADISVTGNQANFTTGTVNVADVVGVSGNRVNLTTNDVTTTAAANILPTGSRVNLSTGTVAFKFIYSVTGSGVNII